MKQVNFKDSKNNSSNKNSYQSVLTVPSPHDLEEKRFIQQNHRQRRQQLPLPGQGHSSGTPGSSRMSRRHHEADHRTILKLFLSTCFILTVLFLFNRFLYLWSYVHESKRSLMSGAEISGLTTEK